MLQRILSRIAPPDVRPGDISASCVDGRHRRSQTGETTALVVGLSLANRSARPLAYDLIGFDVTLGGCCGRENRDFVRHGLLEAGQAATVAEFVLPAADIAAGQTLKGAFQVAYRISRAGRSAVRSPPNLRTGNFAMGFKIDSLVATPTFRWSAI